MFNAIQFIKRVSLSVPALINALGESQWNETIEKNMEELSFKRSSLQKTHYFQNFLRLTFQLQTQLVFGLINKRGLVE